MNIVEEKQDLDSVHGLNFAWPSDEEILRSLAGYASDYSPQAVIDYYRALRTRNFVILAGPAGTDKAGLARTLAEKLVGQDNTQWSLFRAHPWWPLRPVQLPYGELHDGFDTIRLFDLVELARAGQAVGMPFFAAVEQAGPAEVSCYFEDLPRGLIRRADGTLLRVDLPHNLYVTGLLDVEDGAPLGLSSQVLRQAAVIRLHGLRFPWARQRRLFLQPEEGVYAMAVG